MKHDHIKESFVMKRTSLAVILAFFCVAGTVFGAENSNKEPFQKGQLWEGLIGCKYSGMAPFRLLIDEVKGTDVKAWYLIDWNDATGEVKHLSEVEGTFDPASHTHSFVPKRTILGKPSMPDFAGIFDSETSQLSGTISKNSNQYSCDGSYRKVNLVRVENEDSKLTAFITGELPEVGPSIEANQVYRGQLVRSGSSWVCQYDLQILSVNENEISAILIYDQWVSFGSSRQDKSNGQILLKGTYDRMTGRAVFNSLEQLQGTELSPNALGQPLTGLVHLGKRTITLNSDINGPTPFYTKSVAEFVADVTKSLQDAQAGKLPFVQNSGYHGQFTHRRETWGDTTEIEVYIREFGEFSLDKRQLPVKLDILVLTGDLRHIFSAEGKYAILKQELSFDQEDIIQHHANRIVALGSPEKDPANEFSPFSMEILFKKAGKKVTGNIGIPGWLAAALLSMDEIPGHIELVNSVRNEIYERAQSYANERISHWNEVLTHEKTAEEVKNILAMQPIHPDLIECIQSAQKDLANELTVADIDSCRYAFNAKLAENRKLYQEKLRVEEIERNRIAQAEKQRESQKQAANLFADIRIHEVISARDVEKALKRRGASGPETIWKGPVKKIRHDTYNIKGLDFDFLDISKVGPNNIMAMELKRVFMEQGVEQLFVTSLKTDGGFFRDKVVVAEIAVYIPPPPPILWNQSLTKVSLYRERLRQIYGPFNAESGWILDGGKTSVKIGSPDSSDLSTLGMNGINILYSNIDLVKQIEALR